MIKYEYSDMHFENRILTISPIRKKLHATAEHLKSLHNATYTPEPTKIGLGYRHYHRWPGQHHQCSRSQPADCSRLSMTDDHYDRRSQRWT